MFLTHSPYHLLQKRCRLLVFAGVLIGIAAVLASLIFPLEYRADAQVLVISKARYGVDPYTAVKSAERVGENLAQVTGSNDFFLKVMSQQGYDIDKSRFENVSERLKRKRWQKALDVSAVYGTGVLNVSAFSKDKAQAEQLAGAVSAAIVSAGWEYVGGDVGFKIVNEPVATRFPARPNLAVNFVLGFVIGAVLMAVVVLRRYKT